MKQKREGQGAGHNSGSIMPETVSWPKPRMLGVSGVRSEREKVRDLHVANQKLGDLAKSLREDRAEKRRTIVRQTERIRQLETAKLELENARARNLGTRAVAAIQRIFGLRRKSGRG